MYYKVFFNLAGYPDIIMEINNNETFDNENKTLFNNQIFYKVDVNKFDDVWNLRLIDGKIILSLDCYKQEKLKEAFELIAKAKNEIYFRFDEYENIKLTLKENETGIDKFKNILDSWTATKKIYFESINKCLFFNIEFDNNKFIELKNNISNYSQQLYFIKKSIENTIDIINDIEVLNNLNFNQITIKEFINNQINIEEKFCNIENKRFDINFNEVINNTISNNLLIGITIESL